MELKGGFNLMTYILVDVVTDQADPWKTARGRKRRNVQLQTYKEETVYFMATDGQDDYL